MTATDIKTSDQSVPDELLLHARGLIASGYYTEADVLEMLYDWVTGDDQEEVLRTRIPAVLKEAIAAQLKEQGGYPAFTDYDRLQQAFGQLAAEGFLVRENFTCCQTCGWAEADDELANAVEQGRPFKGVVFFHQQDTESAVEGGSLYLAYGGEHGSEVAGQQVVKALETAGLTVNWNGSAKTRICVTLAWQRRFTPS